MWTDLRHLCKCNRKFIRHDSWFQASKPYPLDSIDVMHFPDQMEQIVSGIHAVGTQVDSREYDFLKSMFRKAFYFPDHILKPSAPHPSSRKWDNTVAAELVTSVLYLDKSSGMLCSAL